jgi:hypothetical protein
VSTAAGCSIYPGRRFVAGAVEPQRRVEIDAVASPAPVQLLV